MTDALDIVGSDVIEMREEFTQRFASLEVDIAKVLISRNRIFDKLDNLGTA